MNKLEKSMVSLLNELKNTHNVCGIKAEFETEGTRIEEAMRLKDVASAAGLNLNIKIGGCEAIKDIFDAINLGAERIIAPMVETPYSLQKFISAAKFAYDKNIKDVELLINVETITAFNNFDAMLALPEIAELKGIVIGRGDFTASLGLDRTFINSKSIEEKSLILAEKAKKFKLDVVVGGGVSVDSLPFFKAFPKGHLDRFETRKIIFKCPEALSNNKEAFLKAIEFEIMWLENKKNYYTAISIEDENRIAEMKNRYQKVLNEISQ